MPFLPFLDFHMAESKHICCFPGEAIPLRFRFFSFSNFSLAYEQEGIFLSIWNLLYLVFLSNPPLKIFLPKLYGFKALKIESPHLIADIFVRGCQLVFNPKISNAAPVFPTEVQVAVLTH